LPRDTSRVARRNAGVLLGEPEDRYDRDHKEIDMIVPALILLLGGGSNPPEPMTSASREKPSASALPVEPESWLGAPLQPAADGGWTFSVTPYLWLFGMDGDVRVRNTNVDIDIGFDDIWDNLDFALMGRMEAWQGPLGVYVDPLYGNLGVEGQAGPNDVDVDTEMVLVDFGVLYRVLDHHSAQGRSRTADVSLGGRYYYMKNEIDFAVLADREQSSDWVDLTVGGRYEMDLTDRFGFLVAGDVGGFELGSSSDFAWDAQALGSCRVGGSGRVWAGYRILDVDNDTGGSSGVDVQFSGPIVGYEFRF
jgi:hypothetical protein